MTARSRQSPKANFSAFYPNFHLGRSSTVEYIIRDESHQYILSKGARSIHRITFFPRAAREQTGASSRLDNGVSYAASGQCASASGVRPRT
jgi:hypothetical protein